MIVFDLVVQESLNEDYMIEDRKIREEVCEANLELVRKGLVFHTWGNVSGIDKEKGIVWIKPSGIPYEKLTPDKIVPVSLTTGKIVSGSLRPSSDTPTHLVLYKSWPELGGIVHTHSLYATAWAQARLELPCYGTTHADDFYGCIPCTRALTEQEVTTNYEENTGKVIIETFRACRIDPLQCGAVLVAAHGPFTWGRNPIEAVHKAIVLEYVAKMAYVMLQINPKALPLEKYILEKHFSRKHGPNAYYGQKENKKEE